MKPLLTAILALPWILFACTSVSFEEPQPTGSIDLKTFPDSIRGNYYDYDNENTLQITSDKITLQYTSPDTTHISQLLNNERYTKDSIVNISTGHSYKIQYINDSLFTGYHQKDTLFDLDNKNIILRNLGNNFFINSKKDDSSWNVTRLAFRGNVINLARIETKNELKLMEQITGTVMDSSTKNFKPTREQFEKFIAMNGFINGTTYLRIDATETENNIF